MANPLRDFVDFDERMHEEYPNRTRLVELVVMVILAIVLGLAVTTAVKGGCEPYPVTEHSPSGVAGCAVYGEGTASRWGGPGVARNDCVYPWTACQPILITSLTTGKTAAVTPQMFCDCFQGGLGPNGEGPRIVDLDPATLAGLGLDPAQGLYDVRVDPILIVLPDTAMAR